MTKEAQRIAIAESLGWTRVKPHTGLSWGADAKEKTWVYPHQLPDYLNDLNEMNEAEKTLTPEQSSQMVCEVSKMHIGTGSFYTFNSALLHASASQRAESFLRTIGKWVD